MLYVKLNVFMIVTELLLHWKHDSGLFRLYKYERFFKQATNSNIPFVSIVVVKHQSQLELIMLSTANGSAEISRQAHL